MANRVEFRSRGKEVSRLEAFSDVVFGFALTLIVVSLEVPRTFDEMLVSMKGFLGFAVCFAILCWVWHEHHTFSRRYALEDGVTILLNLILLFVILFYIYPLKFLFTILTGGGRWSDALKPGQSVPLMMIYGLGFSGIFLILALMFRHALKVREKIGLNAVEVHDTVTSIAMYTAYVAIGLTSIAIVYLGGERYAGLAGLFYSVIGPVSALIGYLRGRRREELETAVLNGQTSDGARFSSPEPPAPATP